MRRTERIQRSQPSEVLESSLFQTVQQDIRGATLEPSTPSNALAWGHEFSQVKIFPDAPMVAEASLTRASSAGGQVHGLVIQRDAIQLGGSSAPLPAGSIFGPPSPVYGPFQTPPNQASFLLESALVASPEQLDFGAEIAGDVGRLLELTNHSPNPVTIRQCHISHGGQAFMGQLLDGPVVEPGATARVAIEYYPNLYAAERASLIVETDAGARLIVAVSGPPASELVSKHTGGLEVHPETLQFEPQSLEANSIGYKKILLRNRGLREIKVGDIRAFGSDDSPFALQPGQRDFVVAPGRDLSVGLTFHPKNIGAKTELFYITDVSGNDVYGSFYARGEAIETPTRAPDSAALPDPEACEPLDSKTEHQRAMAYRALLSWNNATERATQRSYNQLRQEWIEYLTYTSLDPTISPATVPDSSVVRSILSNAFGNAIADHGINVESRITPRVASATKRFLTNAALQTGSDVTYHQAAKVAMLLAGGAGFVVGVLIETAAGLLFDWLFPDNTVEKAVQEAYEQGRADGAQVTGEAIKAKVGDLDQAQTSATSERNRQQQQFLKQLEHGCAPEQLEQFSAELELMTQEANAMTPHVGAISNGLLSLWVRDHAISTKRGDKGIDHQWQKATEKLSEQDPTHFGKGEVKNQPDLFMAQCLHEWSMRGLKAPPELQAAVYDEVGASDAALGDSSQTSPLAAKFYARFNVREFVWDSDINHEKLEKGLPRTSNRRANTDWEAVSCKPVLGLEHGCCVVTKFQYRIVSGVHDLQVETFPGDARWHNIEDRAQTDAPPAHVSGQALFDYMAKMNDIGYDIVQETDAANNAALQAKFGEEVAVAAVQHADGRPEPISVYRAQQNDSLAQKSFERLSMPSGATHRTVGNQIIFRAGNTILVIETPNTSTAGKPTP